METIEEWKYVAKKKNVASNSYLLLNVPTKTTHLSMGVMLMIYFKIIIKHFLFSIS